MKSYLLLLKQSENDIFYDLVFNVLAWGSA